MSSPLILALDDDPVIGRLLSVLLPARGMRVEWVRDGDTALARALELVPSLCLLDISVPGIDGVELCRQLKRHAATRDIPVIFLTGAAGDAALRAGFAAGASDFIRKPFSRHELLLRVTTHLEIKTQRDELVAVNRQLEQTNSRLAQLNEEKKELLAVAAHDLRSPILNMLCNLDVIQHDAQATDDDRSCLYREAEQAGRRALELIQAILEAERLEAGQYTLRRSPVHLSAAVAAVVHAHHSRAVQKRQSLRFSPAEAGDVILADPSALERILDNLVSNAVKYTPAGKGIDVAVLRENATLQVVVADQGPGIPAEEIGRLFRKFSRTRNAPTGGEPSTGLGLYVVRQLAEAHGGRVTCLSTVGIGSRFILEIPAAPADALTAPPPLAERCSPVAGSG